MSATKTQETVITDELIETLGKRFYPVSWESRVDDESARQEITDALIDLFGVLDRETWMECEVDDYQSGDRYRIERGGHKAEEGVVSNRFKPQWRIEEKYYRIPAKPVPIPFPECGQPGELYDVDFTDTAGNRFSGLAYLRKESRGLTLINEGATAWRTQVDNLVGKAALYKADLMKVVEA